MGLKNFITGTLGLATIGGAVGAFTASKRIASVEAVPDAAIDRFFTGYAPTGTTVKDAVAKGDASKTPVVVSPMIVRAYRAPGLMPSHHAALAAFGGKQVKGASYIRSDGAKVTVESTSTKPAIPGVSALYGLQALEGCGPRRRRALAGIFFNTFRLSDMYHYLMHYTSDAKKVHDDIIAAGLVGDKKMIHKLIEQYGERSVEIAGGAIEVELRSDMNAAAIVEKVHVSKTHDARDGAPEASKPPRMLGTCLHRLQASDLGSGERETPRTVLVDVIYTAPNPYARAWTSSPYEIQIREWCSDKYGRLLAASVAASLSKL